MTDADSEFSADDLEQLRRLEQFMFDRGYTRDRHGFWIVPGLAIGTGLASDVDDADADE
jgi:hypothetical protein